MPLLLSTGSLELGSQKFGRLQTEISGHTAKQLSLAHASPVFLLFTLPNDVPRVSEVKAIRKRLREAAPIRTYWGFYS